MAANKYVEAYFQLSRAVHEAGLIRRRYGFYWAMIIGWVLTLAGLSAAVVLLGETWYQIIIAALIGVAMAQLGFLAHEAAHREIFASRAWNEWTARILSGLLMGLSYGWWIAKHNSHHAHPNQEGKDPDVDSTVLVLTPDASDRRTGLGAKLARHQGTYFIPLLCLEGLHLHVVSLRTLFAAPGVAHRFSEITLIVIRHAAYLALLCAVLPAGMVLAFVGVQVAVFGLLLGGVFALNHIGMPTVPSGVHIDFLRRQVQYVPKHQRRAAGAIPYGRPAIPDRAPSIPGGSTAQPSGIAEAGPRVLLPIRHSIHRKDPARRLDHGGGIPEPGRGEEQGPVRLPAGAAIPRVRSNR